MPTSPDRLTRAEDEVVNLLSRWLAGHLRNAELEAGLTAVGASALQAGQARAVDELLGVLATAADGERGDLEMMARETLEAVALG